MNTATKFLSLAALAVAGHPASAETAPLDVRVMTFNVKQHNPTNKRPAEEPAHWERRKPVAFDAIRHYSPDIVGLQEPYRPQIDDLREALLQFDEVGEGRRGESRDEHCTILYRADRFRAAASGTFWLSDTPEKPSTIWGHFYPRICTWVRLIDKKSGRGIYVFNTHLDHKSQTAREKAVRLIARRIRARKHKDPFVLAGDFNAGEDNPVVAYLRGDQDEASPVPAVDSFRVLHPDEKNVGTGNRFEGRADGPKIDYIFVPPEAEVLEASIIRTHKGEVFPSDHYPVTARIRFGGGSDHGKADLPKDVPPVPGTAVAVAPGDDEKGWAIQLTVPKVVWEVVGERRPKIEWPEFEVSVEEAFMELQMFYQPATQLADRAQNRVLDLKGRRLGREEALKRLAAKTPVLVSVSGKMPDPFYLQSTKPDTLIVALGIPAAPAPELLPRPAAGDDKDGG